MAGKQKEMKKQEIGDWLYFCPEEISVRALHETLASSYETEIWEDAGVLEIVLGEKSSFDIESAKIHPKDEVTATFAKEQGAKSVFLATFVPGDSKEADAIMRQILNAHGGIFCGDTEDFMPQVKA